MSDSTSSGEQAKLKRDIGMLRLPVILVVRVDRWYTYQAHLGQCSGFKPAGCFMWDG